MPSWKACPPQYFGVSLAGVEVKSKPWSFVSCFFTQRLLIQVKKMLTKENKRKDCLILYEHKMCSIVLIEAICFRGWGRVVIKQPIFVTWLYLWAFSHNLGGQLQHSEEYYSLIVTHPLLDSHFNPHNDTVSFRPQYNYCSVDIKVGKEKKTMAWKSKL